jgi:signal transduction histidine kinase
VERNERETVDDRLQRTAEITQANALLALEREVPLDSTELDDVLRASGTSVRLQVGGLDFLDLGTAPSTPVSPRAGLRTVTQGDRRYRVYTAAVDDPTLSGLARIEAATRVERIERRQRELDRNLLLFGSIALLLAVVATFVFANVLLRPLQRLRKLTHGIAGSEDLDQRIPADEGPAELRALAESFDEMLARLAQSSADRERALEATRRFAADAGHELRTPLTSVQANLSALHRHPGLPVEKRTALLEDALGEQQRLVALLDGLQALARGDVAPLEHAPVDLAEQLDHTLEAIRARYPGTRFEVELPEDPVEVEGWAPGLRLVLDNLVRNAAHHGRPGGTVRVALSGNGHGADLVVEDDGRGIPEADRGRVFEPFARVDGTTVPGSGLGLALVAQQAGHHGADVALEDSEALGGLRVRVHFPPSPPPRQD